VSDRAATRQDFPTSPMPVARGLLPFDYTIPAQLYQRLLRGKIPQDMDDRWFVFAEREWVYIHRSWSGYCVFQLRFEARPGGYLVAEAWVNLDPAQNRLAEGGNKQAELTSQAARLRRILEGKWLHL
jgi:hypothetical protein